MHELQVQREDDTSGAPVKKSWRELHHHDRIARLNEQLALTQDSSDNDVSSRFQHLQTKMKMLDEKLAQSKDIKAKKFWVVREQLATFKEQINEERQVREGFGEEGRNNIVQTQAALDAALEAEQQARRDTEARILTVFDTRTKELTEEIMRAGREGMDQEANLRRYLETDIPKLYESLKDEVENREVMEQRMLQKAMDEVTQLQAAVLSEKKAREDTEEAMLRMMEDIVAKMQSEIAQEREEREQAEDMLLNLLHDTLVKLEGCMRPADSSSRFNSTSGDAAVTPVQ